MPWWMMQSRLRAPEEGADGGAGGDGSGGDDSKTVTKEQISNMINSAVSTHVGRALKKSVGEIVPEIVKQVTAALKPGDGDGGGGEGDGGGEGGGEGGGKVDPEFTAMKRRQTQLANELKTEKEARQRAEKSASDDKLRNEVMSGLGKNNITGERQGAAIASLYHNGRVKTADDGAHLFIDTNGDELPLGDGLKTWAASDGAKLYLPPREVKGSGDSGGGRVPDLKVKDDGLKTAYKTALEGVEQHILNQ